MTLPRTPEILKYLVEGCTRGELARKPAPDRFSVAEVMAHLHHGEVHCYGERLRRILSEAEPKLEAYDTDSILAAGTYSGHDALIELTEFEIVRRENLELLAGVDMGRVVHHARVGPITVENMISEWACHDLGHVRQVAELIRWVTYGSTLGPWAEEYKIRP